MANDSSIQEIKEHLGEGRMDKALELLNAWAEEQDQDVNHQALILSARWKQFKIEQRAGILSSEQENTQKNRILYDLLRILSQTPGTTPPIRRWIKAGGWLLGGLWCLAGIGTMLLWQCPATKAFVEIDVHSQFVRLTTREASSLFDGESLSRVQLQNFDELSLPADTVLIDWDLDNAWDEEIALENNLSLKPDIGASFLMSNVRLASLEVPPGTNIGLELANAHRLNLDLSKDERIEARFFLPDTLRFRSEESYITGWEVDYLGEPFEGQIIYPSIPPNLTISAQRLFLLLLEFEDSITISQARIPLTSLDWNTIDRSTQDRKVMSTIQAATVHLTEPERTFSLKEHQFLSVQPSSPFYLQRMNVTSRDIYLQLAGEVSHLKRGIEWGSLTSLMPNRLEHAWASTSWIFLVGAFLLVGLTVAYVYVSKKFSKRYEIPYSTA